MPVTNNSTPQELIAAINALANEPLQKDGRLAIKQATETKGVTVADANGDGDSTYQELVAAINNIITGYHEGNPLPTTKVQAQNPVNASNAIGIISGNNLGVNHNAPIFQVDENYYYQAYGTNITIVDKQTGQQVINFVIPNGWQIAYQEQQAIYDPIEQMFYFVCAGGSASSYVMKTTRTGAMVGYTSQLSSHYGRMGVWNDKIVCWSTNAIGVVNKSALVGGAVAWSYKTTNLFNDLGVGYIDTVKNELHLSYSTFHLVVKLLDLTTVRNISSVHQAIGSTTYQMSEDFKYVYDVLNNGLTKKIDVSSGTKVEVFSVAVPGTVYRTWKYKDGDFLLATPLRLTKLKSDGTFTRHYENSSGVAPSNGFAIGIYDSLSDSFITTQVIATNGAMSQLKIVDSISIKP